MRQKKQIHTSWVNCWFCQLQKNISEQQKILQMGKNHVSAGFFQTDELNCPHAEIASWKAFHLLQHPAEHVPAVKIKGCWTQDFILLLLLQAFKEQLMKTNLVKVNTPSHASM